MMTCYQIMALVNFFLFYGKPNSLFSPFLLWMSVKSVQVHIYDACFHNL